MSYLGQAGVGRVAVSTSALPAIYTMFYALKDEHVVMRVAPNCRLSRALNGSVVAFSVDNMDRDKAEGWSVLVQGLGEEVADPWVVAELETLDLPSWSEVPESDRFVRVSIENLSGSRLCRLRLPATIG